MDLEREPALIDVLRDWLFEQGVNSEVGHCSADGNFAEIRGFGWAILIENTNVTFANRLCNETIKASVADPTILDTIKTKILQVESKTMDYIIEHVDDDGWKDWKPPQGSI